jgi:DNA-binding NarL/FixJ family response regulator
MEGIHVVLAPNHPIGHAGAQLLETALHLFDDLAPDVLLVDMALSDATGPPPSDQAQEERSPRVFVIRGQDTGTYIFGLRAARSSTSLSEQHALQLIIETIQAGLENQVSGQSQRIIAKLPARGVPGAAPTHHSLTVRELEVLRSLSTGVTDRAMGEQLGVSERTIQYHLSNIYKKLGVKRRSEAITWALRAGFSDA